MTEIESMNTINRFAIVVVPKEPFFAWARGLGGEPLLEELAPNDLSTVYLAEASDEDEPNAVVRWHFKEIFDEQLMGWHTDEGAWPAPRTFAMFREWFDARVVDMVFDLSDGPIEHDS